MSKKCKVTECNSCPHMDNIYYDYARTCTMLDKEIKSEDCDIYEDIYSGCPLKDWEVDED